MKRKSVLILLENLSMPFDRRAWQQARALKQSGCSVSVICPRFKGERSLDLVEGIYIYRYSSPPIAKGILGYMFEFVYCFIMTFLLSIWVFIKRGFDIIQSGNPPDTFFMIGLFYKALGKKFYYDHRDLCPEIYLSKYGEHKKDLLYRLLLMLEFLTYKTADRIIVTNDSYRENAIKRGKLDPSKVFVVRGAPDLGRFKRSSPDMLLKRNKSFLVTYLGVMAPQDGVDYLLLAIDMIVNRYKRKDIQFALIGSGDSFSELKKLSDHLDLNGAVSFTGRITDGELIRYLSTSDVCVAPDPKNPLNDKSTMNKILEYMAMARPIVSFDLKETRYSAGEAALYATPNNIQEFADKIIELLEDSRRREEMGRIGYERISKKLSWDYNKNRLLQVYSN